MTFYEFEKQLRKDVDYFIQKYEDNHIHDPENWPLEMEPMEWFEKFLLIVPKFEVLEEDSSYFAAINED